MGSEHAVGWNLVLRLAARHPIILITQDNEFRHSIESAVQDLRTRGHTIKVFFVRHGASTDGRKNNLRLFYYLTYIAYQWRVYQLARQVVRTHDIALAHHLTIVGFREPGFLWRLNIPFIWGPVGGLVFTPRSLFGELSAKMKLFQHIRNAATWLQFHLSPRVRLAYRATQRAGGAFIAATPDIGERFQAKFGGHFTWIPETGSADAPPKPTAASNSAGASPTSLKLLWVGALVDIKPLGMLLRAIADVPSHAERISIIVVGDGDSRMRYEAMASRLGIQASFLGWRPHTETLDYFRAADLFALISVKDLTTNVVFESLGAGLPVLCLAHHGYSYVVDSSCGIKIGLTSAKQIHAELVAHLDKAAENLSELRHLAAGARQRASEYTWSNNASAISTIYATNTSVSVESRPAFATQEIHARSSNQ